MSSVPLVHEQPITPEGGTVNYLNVRHSIASWLLTVDHKRICILYLVSITFFFIIGGLAATLIRLELITPGGDLLTADGYNKAFTAHGIVMIFFFLIPSIPATLGNFLIPIMIGARDLAFPKLNLLSWYLLMIGAVVAMTAIFAGGVDTGWTFYTPYSSRYSNTYVSVAIIGAFLAGFSSILTGLNFVVTVHMMRAPGMYWSRLPLFVWALYATSLIQILATPVLAITLLLVAIERSFRIGIFDPALGGDPVLFQHMFWFYSHPAVYIMILPGMGVINEAGDLFLEKKDLRLRSDRYCSRCLGGYFVPGLGTSHVRGRPIDLCRNGVFDLEFRGWHSLRRQGIQLDGNDVSGIHLL